MVRSQPCSPRKLGQQGWQLIGDIFRPPRGLAGLAERGTEQGSQARHDLGKPNVQGGAESLARFISGLAKSDCAVYADGGTWVRGCGYRVQWYSGGTGHGAYPCVWVPVHGWGVRGTVHRVLVAWAWVRYPPEPLRALAWAWVWYPPELLRAFSLGLGARYPPERLRHSWEADPQAGPCSTQLLGSPPCGRRPRSS